MTLDEITKRVEHIRTVEDDYEAAHAYEDSLMRDFIIFISSFDEYPEISHMAKEVLKTMDIPFARYCA